MLCSTQEIQVLWSFAVADDSMATRNEPSMLLLDSDLDSALVFFCVCEFFWDCAVIGLKEPLG